MDSHHNSEGPKWVLPKGSANFVGRCWHQLAALAGLYQGTFFVAVINARHDSFRAIDQRAHEPELVMARHVTKRRDVKDFVGLRCDAPLGFMQKIAVSLAKGIVHLGHYGGQTLVLPVAIPKAHGLEGVA